MFWVVAAVLSLGVAAYVLRPLLRRAELQEGDVNPDISIYRNQLKELERDVATGAIGTDEAKSAQAEISRRLLAASDEEQISSSGLSTRQRMITGILVVLVVPIFAVLIYLQNGNPEYGAMPYTDHNGEAGLWMQYGRAYMQASQFADAEEAFRVAIDLSDPRADLYEALGESIILGGDGSIPRGAVEAFEKALEIDPARERSQYILAEWVYRSGDRETGVRRFIEILENTRDETFQALLKERIDDAISEIKDELAGEPAAQRAQPEPASPLAGMSEDQQARIRQMVAGLAERLESEPDNLEGWLRLIRSYVVLQQMNDAQMALQKAMPNFLSERESMDRILSLAEELGLVKGPELPPGAKDFAPLE